MTDPYANIRLALDVIDECAGKQLMTRDRCARLRKAADTIRALLAERDALAEGLSDTEKNVALAQAVEFAEYVERQAKGAMREAARRFLSLPYSQGVEKRLKERDALLEACRLAARYLNPDQFPDAVKKIDAAIAQGERA